jgi:hypothetical protein
VLVGVSCKDLREVDTMSKEPRVLSVVSVEAKPPTIDGVRIVIQGEDEESVALDMPREGLLMMSALVDQLALDIETTRHLGKVAPPEDNDHVADQGAPVVVPVRIARTLDTVRMPDGGMLLDVGSVMGERLRLSISREQAANLLFALVPTGSSGSQ